MSDNTQTTTATGDGGTTITATTTGTGYVLGQNENQNDKPTGGDAGELTKQLTTEKSANALIKDFAKARNLTVAQVLEQFTTAENAQKTEAQRLQDQVKDLERKHGEAVTELQRERAENVFRNAAATAGARAERLGPIFRAYAQEIEYDSDGKPTNVATLVEKAKAEMSEFFQRVSGSGDGGKGAGDTGSDPNAVFNRAIRQAAGVSN